MIENPQVANSLVPLLEPSSSEATARDISSAESLTVVIHGVGKSTAETLLTTASTGYLASGFPSASERILVPDCPTLSGEKGAEAIFIPSSQGGHFVIALPWTDRQVRLFDIASCSAIVLLVMTMMMVVAFVLHNLLDSNGDLFSWGLPPLLASAAVFFLRRLFKVPWGFIVGPFLLSLALKIFINFHVWLLLPLAILIVTLLTIASLSIARCIPLVPTVGWRLSLMALIVALSLPAVATIAIASHGGSKFPPPPDPVETANSTASLNVTELFRPPSGTSPEIPNPPPESRAHKLLEKFIDLVDKFADRFHPLAEYWRDLVPGLAVVAICMAVCLIAMGFSGILDFGLDVFDYTNDESTRALLLSRTADTIRWLHQSAPSAPLIVIGHSLGSVIASHAVSSLSDSDAILSQISLITLGSPLNYLYRLFPKEVKSPRELYGATHSKMRWINLWRRSDRIGKELDVGENASVQYCVGDGGHTGYWSDGAVWSAVAYEALRVGSNHRPPNSGGGPAKCLLETKLGGLIFMAIAVLSVVGVAGLWYVFH